MFHLDARLLGGGFLGVDVFFVISGYLIADRLIDVIQTRRFSTLDFYQRRVARLAPAALAVIALTLIASAFVYSAQDFAALGSSSFAAAMGVINFKLVFLGAYFELSPDSQPLTHYWSLAIEEQFYFLFPIFFPVVLKVTRPLPVLAIFCAASFATCIAMMSWAPVAAFYLLPARAWELFAGSILAVAQRRGLPARDAKSSFLLGTGLTIVLLSFYQIQSDDSPGWIELCPVIGSTMILAAIDLGRGAFHRALAHPALVFIGERSYSLYLCHLPVFSIIGHRFFLANPSMVVALKILVAVVVALLCHAFVERPMLSHWSAPHRMRWAFGATALGVALVGVAGYVVRTNYYLSANADSVETGGVAINPRGNRLVALIGDSTASAHGYELAKLARKLDFRLNILSAAGENELPGEPRSLWEGISRFLMTNRPDVVMIAERWSTKLEPEGRLRFGEAMAQLLEKSDRIVVVTEPPEPPADATRRDMLAGARAPFFEAPATRLRHLRVNAAIRTFESDRLRVLDLNDIFLDDDGAIRMIADDGRLTYQDRRHLSDSGSARIRGEFEKILKDCLNISDGR